MSSRAALVTAYAAAQALGYVVLALPGGPGYDGLEPGVWMLMDLGVFVTLALAGDLPFSPWAARVFAVGSAVAVGLGPADDHPRAVGTVVLWALVALMVVAAAVVRRRERGGSDGDDAPAAAR